MNVLVLLIGLRVWQRLSAIGLLTRLFMTVSVFSIETQIATWSGLATIRSLVWLNILLAVSAFAFWRHLPSGPVRTPRRPDALPVAAAMLSVALIVAALNIANPLQAADPYNLERVDRILHTGTISYDPEGEVKTNILSPVYELVIADVHQIPMVGPSLVRLHGLAGFVTYLVALGVVREQLGASPQWPWMVMLVVPVVFHQFVLLKNDLFTGVLSLISLVWVSTRTGTARAPEILWISWLTGLAVSVKLTNLPVALILTAAVVWAHRWNWRMLGSLLAGGFTGAFAGGLVFTLVENARTYGHLMPTESIGNRHEQLADMATGIARFWMSLLDLGLMTPQLWPGRGGWGGTFGLPLIWAIGVLVMQASKTSLALRALLSAAVSFVFFAAFFPDADIAHRLVLGPGLLLIAVAAHVVSTDDLSIRPFRLALIPVVALSSAQIIRSALLYATRL